MKICPKCHTAYKDEALFCASCGIPLPAGEEAKPADMAAVYDDTTLILDKQQLNSPVPNMTGIPLFGGAPIYEKVPETVNGPIYEQAPETVLAGDNTPTETKGPKKNFLKILLPLALLLALVALGIVFLPKLLAGKEKPQNFVFSRDGVEGVYGITPEGKVIPAPAEIEKIYLSSEGSRYSNYFYDSQENAQKGRTLWTFQGESFRKVAEQVVSGCISLNGVVAYLTEDEALYVFDGTNTTHVAGGVKYLSCISPDGKAVGYVTENNKGDTYGYCAHYGKKQVYELGKLTWPVAIANNASYIYYRNSSDNLYVQKGNESEKAEKIGAFPDYSILYLNADGSQAVLQANNGQMYYCEKLVKEKISDIGHPVPAVGTRAQQYGLLGQYGYRSGEIKIYDVKSLKDMVYYNTSSETAYYLNGDLETRTLVKNVYTSLIVADNKTVLYHKNEGVYMVDPTKIDAPAEKLLQDVSYSRFNSKSRSWFYESDDESYVMKIGDKPQRVMQEVADGVIPFKKGFIYFMDDMVYYTEGGRGTKISGLEDSVSFHFSNENWALFSDSEGSYYLTTDGKTARKVWD